MFVSLSGVESFLIFFKLKLSETALIASISVEEGWWKKIFTVGTIFTVPYLYFKIEKT